MRTLYKLTDIVLDLLKEQPETRNSDNVLYYNVIKRIGKETGVDIDTMSLPNFLLHMKSYGLPSIESVGRCRRKCVESYPELAGIETVETLRTVKEEEYRKYSKLERR